MQVKNLVRTFNEMTKVYLSSFLPVSVPVYLSMCTDTAVALSKKRTSLERNKSITIMIVFFKHSLHDEFTLLWVHFLTLACQMKDKQNLKALKLL